MTARQRLILIFVAIGLLTGLAAGRGDTPGGFAFGSGEAAGYGDSRDQVGVRVVLARDRVAPGGDLPLAVILEHSPKWHVYAAEGDLPEDYYRTVIEIDVPEGSPIQPNLGFTQWPESHEIDFFGDELQVYEGRAIIYIPMTIDAAAVPGAYTIRVKPAYQACDDTFCLPPTPYPGRPAKNEPASDGWADYGYDVTINVVPLADAGGATPPPDGVFDDFGSGVYAQIHAGVKPPEIVDFDVFGLKFSINAAGTLGFILLLLITALGGFLLNLTPCVLPVIPLKIMGLSAHASNRKQMFAPGTAMSVGVIGFWLGLGVAIAAVAGFTATNQLFQYPVFTISVGVVIAVMAIGMCGLFAVRLPTFVYRLNPRHDSYAGSFGFGIMTAILSTPCTAPFMGAAAAFATTLHPSKTLAIFGAIGIGMALPYQVLSMFPHLVEKMPRSGPASALIKQVMGLLMLAAAAFFVGTGLSGFLANPPAPPSRIFWWVVAALGIAAGTWMAWRTIRIATKTTPRVSFTGVGLLIVAISIAVGYSMTDKGPIDWVYYTPQRFAEIKAENKVIVMEFTAEWCLNCKALEKTVLRDPRVVQFFEDDSVVPIKVDLTGRNALGNEMLKEVNRLTIPLLVVFGPDGSEKFKGDFYTPEQVIDAVNEARPDRVAKSR